MHVLMFLGGLISLAAGAVALGIGIVEHRLGIATILITPGTIGVVGGLALLGIGAISARLARLAEMLETQPLPRSIAVTPDDPALREAALGGDIANKPAKPRDDAAPAVKPPPAVTIDPPTAMRAPNVAPPVISPAAPPIAALPPPAPPDPPAEGAPHILKSGVIEGMAYTLYSNGAVDAELPRQGTVRFASIANWRAHIRGEQ